MALTLTFAPPRPFFDRIAEQQPGATAATQPYFRLDENPVGDLFWRVSYKIDPGADLQDLSFSSSAVEQTATVEGQARAEDVRGSAAVANTVGVLPGLLQSEIPLYRGNAQVASLRFYLVRHTRDDLLWFYISLRRSAGATGPPLTSTTTITGRIGVSFQGPAVRGALLNDVRYDPSSASDLEWYDGRNWNDVEVTSVESEARPASVLLWDRNTTSNSAHAAPLLRLSRTTLRGTANTAILPDSDGQSIAFWIRLDDRGVGEYQYALGLSLSPSAELQNLSFSPTAVEQSTTLAGSQDAVALETSPAETINNASSTGGILQQTVSLYTGSTKQGDLSLYLVRTADYIFTERGDVYMGVALRWSGEAAAAEHTWVLSSTNLLVRFQGGGGPPFQINEVRYDETSPSDLERYDGSQWLDLPAMGGGGGLRELFSGNVNLTANVWADTGYDLPSDYATKLFAIDFGGERSEATLVYGEPIARGGTNTVSAAASRSNARVIIRVGTREYWLSRTTANDLLIASLNASFDAMPLKIWDWSGTGVPGDDEGEGGTSTIRGSLSWAQGDTTIRATEGGRTLAAPSGASPQLPQATASKAELTSSIRYRSFGVPPWLTIDRTTRRVTLTAGQTVPAPTYPINITWVAESSLGENVVPRITQNILVTITPTTTTGVSLAWTQGGHTSIGITEGTSTLDPSSPQLPQASLSGATGTPTYTLRGLPSWLTFNSTTRRLSVTSGQTAPAPPGYPFNMTLVASFMGAPDIYQNILITIEPATSAGVSLSWTQGGATSFGITEGTSTLTPDPDSNALSQAALSGAVGTPTYTLRGVPGWLSFNRTTRKLSVTAGETAPAPSYPVNLTLVASFMGAPDIYQNVLVTVEPAPAAEIKLSWAQGNTSIGITEGTTQLTPGTPTLPQAVLSGTTGTPVYTLHGLPSWLTYTASNRTLSVTSGQKAPPPGYPINLTWSASFMGAATIYQNILVTIEPAVTTGPSLSWTQGGDTSIRGAQGSQTLNPATPTLPQAALSGATGTPTYALRGLPSWLTFNSTTRRLTANANAPAPTYPTNMTLVASFMGAQPIYQNILVTITPTATAGPSLSWSQGDTSIGATEGSQTLNPAAPTLPQAALSGAVGTPTYTLHGKPSWLTFASATRRLTANANAPAPTYPINMTLAASFMGAETIYQNILVTIAPEAAPATTKTLSWAQGGDTSVGATQGSQTLAPASPQLPQASLSGGGTVTYTVHGLPSWLTFTASTRRLSANANAPAPTYPINLTYTASATGAQSISQNILVTITPTGGTTATGARLSWGQGGDRAASIIQGSRTLNPSSPQLPQAALTGGTGTITYTLNGRPSWLTINTTTRRLSVTSGQTAPAPTYPVNMTWSASAPGAQTIYTNVLVTITPTATGETPRSAAITSLGGYTYSGSNQMRDTNIGIPASGWIIVSFSSPGRSFWVEVAALRGTTARTSFTSVSTVASTGILLSEAVGTNDFALGRDSSYDLLVGSPGNFTGRIGAARPTRITVYRVDLVEGADFNLGHVFTEIPALNDQDRMLVGDLSAGLSVNRYVTLANLKTFLQFLVSDVASSLTATTVADTDRMVVSDESNQATPNRYILISELKKLFAGTFSLHDSVSTAIPALGDDDRLLVSDESESGDPNRYATIGQLKTLFGSGDFDLHDDVDTEIVAVSASDRLLISDESESDDPNRYVTIQDLADYFAFKVSDVATAITSGTVADTDRMVLSDESNQATPNRYILISELKKLFGSGDFHLHDDVDTEIAALSASDRMVVSDESESGDPNRYVTLQDLKSFVEFKVSDVGTALASGEVADSDRMVLSDESNQATPNRYITIEELKLVFGSSGGGGSSDFDLHDDVANKIAALSANDRILVSDEGTVGDPNRYATLSDLKTYVEFLVSDVSSSITSGDVADSDRMVLSDESEQSTPNKYILISELKKLFMSAAGGGTLEASTNVTFDTEDTTASEKTSSQSIAIGSQGSTQGASGNTGSGSGTTGSATGSGSGTTGSGGSFRDNTGYEGTGTTGSASGRTGGGGSFQANTASGGTGHTGSARGNTGSAGSTRTSTGSGGSSRTTSTAAGNTGQPISTQGGGHYHRVTETHSHTAPSHSHAFAIGSHSHPSGSHTHSGPSHTHGFSRSNHTHPSGSHTHSGPSHRHSIVRGSHTHSFSITGSHTHSIGGHTHSLNSHTHGRGSLSLSPGSHTHSFVHDHGLKIQIAQR